MTPVEAAVVLAAGTVLGYATRRALERRRRSAGPTDALESTWYFCDTCRRTFEGVDDAFDHAVEHHGAPKDPPDVEALVEHQFSSPDEGLRPPGNQ